MQKDILDAQRRLSEAQKVVDLSPAHREILCDIISAELGGTLGGCYEDIPIQVYHHPLCTGYSSTTIKRMIEQSYNHWYLQQGKQSKPLRFGSAFHAFCNEPHNFEIDYQISTADNRRGRDFRELNQKYAGKIVLTAPEFKTIEVMSRKLFEHPDAAPLLKGAKFELTYFHYDSVHGLWKKCRLDAIKGMCISDLKTTQNASLDSFQRDGKKFLYRISAAYYMQIVSEVTGQNFHDFYLIACESEEPNEIATYRVRDQSIARANDEIDGCLKTIRAILDQGDKAWKGYALGIREIDV